MKLTANTFVTKAALVLTLALFITSAASAQTARKQKPVLKKYAVENIVNGIKSEYDGVRKVTISLAGKCELEKAVDTLIEQLKEEKSPELRVSIALSLYKIGDDKGLDAIYANAVSEKDPHVKRMLEAIVQEYAVNKEIFVSTSN